MRPVVPVFVVDLFPPLSGELLNVLWSLQPSDWGRLTACSPWTVKDVAAHLLGGNLSRLWNVEEKATSADAPGLGFDELLELINRQNEAWVQAAQRISPEMLVKLLDLTDRRLYEHFRRLDPYEMAGISVAWVSDDPAPNWLDIAREYSEKWLHQQHIREAVGLPLLLERVWLSPVLETFIYALPRAFREEQAVEGSSVAVKITGEAGGEWSLVREGSKWQLFKGLDPQASARVQIDQALAWRLFTKGVTKEEARAGVRIAGNRALGERVLDTVSIMA
jgi:uncharacterized protein (TIGR03083 family)